MRTWATGPGRLGLVLAGWALVGGWGLAARPATLPARLATDGDVLQATISGPARASVGQVVTWVATTRNVGLVDATGVVPTLQLPAGLGGVVAANGSYDPATGLVIFRAMALPAGASVAHSASFVAHSLGPYAGRAASTASSPAETVLDNNNGSADTANLLTAVAGPLGGAASVRDGSPTSLGAGAPDGELVVNTYYPAGAATEQLASGATSLAVGLPTGATDTGIAPGDLLLVMQMQGADLDATNTDAYGDGLAGGSASGYQLGTGFVAGTYEYVLAGSSLAPGSAGTLTLASGLLHSYANVPATATTGPRTFQVIRVPQYGNVTLGADLHSRQWDGATGGVLAVEAAGTLDFAGYALSASQRGFRGGQGRLLTTAAAAASYVAATDETTAYGQKGESLAGAPQYMRYYDAAGITQLATNPAGDTYPGGGAGRGAPANGGGGTALTHGGGGGGGAAGPGGRGGYDTDNNPNSPNFSDARAFGGAPVLQVSSSRLVMGGGGGSGVAANASPINADVAARFTSGSQGGGIVLLRAGAVAGTGTIEASGRDSGSVVGDGAGVNASTGGGGAGGCVVVALRNPSGLAGIAALATGGKGGDNSNPAAPQFGPGGGGSGGFVFANGAFASVSTAAGRAGYTQSSVNGGTTDTFGATDGTLGVVAALPVAGGASAANASGGAPGVAASADRNDAPAANPDLYATAPGSALVLDGAAATPRAGILTNDSDAVGGLDATSVDLDPVAAGRQAGSASSPVAVPGGSAYVNNAGQLTFTPAAGFRGTSIFSYTVSDNYGKTSAPALVRVAVGEARLDLATAVSTTASQPVEAGALVPFTLTARNATAGAAAPQVVQAAQLPAGLTAATLVVGGSMASATSGSQRTYTDNKGAPVATYDATTGQLTYAATTLAAASSRAYSFSVAAPASGPFSVAALVGNDTPDPRPANNVATATVAVATHYDLAATIAGPSTAPVAGSLASYIVTARATGALAPQVVQTVAIGTGRAGVYATGGGTYDATTGLVTFPAASLDAGQAVTNVVSFVAPTAGTVLAPVATFDAVSLAADTDPRNNAATAPSNATAAATGTAAQGSTAATGTTANLRSSLVAQLSSTGAEVAPGAVAAGTSLTYIATLTNDGPSPAVAAQQMLALPKGLSSQDLQVAGSTAAFTLGTFTTYTRDAGLTPVASYDAATGVLRFATEAAPLTAQNTRRYTFSLAVPAALPALAITAVAGSATSDPAPADNLAAAPVTVLAAPSLRIQLLGPATTLAGQPVAYSLTTATTAGPAARQVRQVIALPAGLLISATDSSGLQLGGQLPTAVDAGTGLATFADGTSYDPATGQLALAAMATLGSGQQAQRIITYLAPGASSPVVATAQAEGATGPVTASTVVAPASSPASDVVVAVSGPAAAVVGAPLSYVVAVRNQGPVATIGTAAVAAWLPVGLPVAGPAAVRLNGQAPVASSGSTATYPDNSTYNAASGLLTLPALADQAAGPAGVATTTLTFAAPDAPALNVAATATLANASHDLNPAHNAAVGSTRLGPATVPATDLRLTLTTSAASQVAGQSLTFTLTPSNASPTNAATNVRLQLALAADLPVRGARALRLNGNAPASSAGSLVTYPDGSTYDQRTGLITWPVLATLGAGGSGPGYTAALPAPAVGPLLAVASGGSDNLDPDLSNNMATQSVSITASADLATGVSGPASLAPGAVATYLISTTNLAPTAAAAAGGSPAAVQQVLTVPAGVVASQPVLSGPRASQATITGSAAAGYTITVPLGTIAPGAANATALTLALSAAPASSQFALQATSGAVSGVPADPNAANNAAAQTIGVALGPLVASEMLNMGPAGTSATQKPLGNTASAVPITALATASTGAAPAAAYRLLSVPTATQGTLYLGGAALVGPRTLSLAEAQQLAFAPARPFAGNATFLFAATDGQGQSSRAARYTIPVGPDVPAAYTNTPPKTSLAAYQNGDVITSFFDANGGRLNSAGQVADNGVRRAAAGSFSGPAGTSGQALADLGLALDPASGQLHVGDRTKLQAGTYSLAVTTTDANEGVTTQAVRFGVGETPLPVVLVAFTAQPVQNRDAQLNWITASELRSASFTVERSFDGQAFSAVHELAAQGSKPTATSYAWLDAGIGARVGSGPIYYRLRQTDLDGTTAYSAVQAVRFAGAAAGALALYPNPAQASATLSLSSLPAGTYQVRLLDALGRVVRQLPGTGGLSQPLDLADLAPGAYLVQVASTDGAALRLQIRLVKE